MGVSVCSACLQWPVYAGLSDTFNNLPRSPSYYLPFISKVSVLMTFGIATASLVSVIVEAILFGFFSVLFVLTSYLLLYKKAVVGPLRTRFFYASFVMYILAITHLAVNIQRSLVGFTSHFDSEETSIFVSNQGHLNILRIIIYVLQSLLGDGITIYRLYIVCNGDYRVLVTAFIILVGNVTIGIGLILTYSKQPSSFQISSENIRWMVAFFLLTFVINFGGTVLITARIWLARRKTSSIIQTPGFSPLTVVLLDPGIVYSVTLLFIFGLFLAETNALYTVFEWITHIIGIVFSLIIIRIGFRSLWNGRLDFTSAQAPKHHLRILPKVNQSTRCGSMRDTEYRSSIDVSPDVTTPRISADLKGSTPDRRDTPK